MWSQIFGGGAIDVAEEIIQTSDGGYAVAGWTGSIDDSDFWLIKIDSFGNMEWNRTCGNKGSGGDLAYSLVETSDGGYALAGTTNSFGSGSYDFCLVRTDGAGNMVWNQTFGGSENDRANSLVEASDGEFVIAGRTKSFGAGESDDLWLIKTDSTLTPTPTPEPESFPTTIVLVSIATIAVIATGILVYIKKYKK